MNAYTRLTKALHDTLTQLNLAPEKPYETLLNVDHQRAAFGDLSCNAALIAAQALGKNPRHIAQQIIEQFKHPYIQEITIAGPGFLNIRLTEIFFKDLLQELITQGDNFFKPNGGIKNKQVNIEFVSANPTGPLHIGHGRGGIIGDVLGTIMRFSGSDVTKEFYINDAGAQIDKLGASFKMRCLQVISEREDTAHLPGVTLREAWVPEDGYHGEYLKELAQQAYATYGDAVATQPESWYADYAKTYLLEKIKKTLENYHIHYDVWFSEKTLHASGAITQALEKLHAHGFLYEKEGALWFASTRFGDDKDRVVRRASGELTYVAADIAYLENKLARGAQKIIMVLGQDHHSYVVRLKAVLQALGKDPAILDVILYQLVTIKESGEAVRLSKRAGRIVSLEDIITEVGPDVARFFYLHRKADAHLEFDLDLALKHSDENPVYYIQYAYVRTLSILQKATHHTDLAQISVNDIPYLTQAEHMLLKKIVTLKKLLEDITLHYQTHMLTYYLYELAQLFHGYYGSTKVLDLENIPVTRARLLVITQLRDTINLCLRLLGVSTPEKM